MGDGNLNCSEVRVEKPLARTGRIRLIQVASDEIKEDLLLGTLEKAPGLIARMTSFSKFLAMH